MPICAHREAQAKPFCIDLAALIEPSSDGYDAARAVHNGMIDRHTAAIARCADAADVIAAVDLAREHGLLVSVRGGGHNVNGFASNDDGLVIDLSAMRGVRVDPERRTARVEGGATWGDFDHASRGFGLASTGGVVSTTGVGGLTLGGGIGHLTRARTRTSSRAADRRSGRQGHRCPGPARFRQAQPHPPH